MKKKRILFVNGHLHVGGIEKTLTDLLRHIDYSQYEVDLLLIRGLGEYAESLPLEVNVLIFDTESADGPFWASLWRNIKRGKNLVLLYRIIIFLASVVSIKFYTLLAWVLPLKGRYDCAIAYRTGICADIVAFSVKSMHKFLWWHNGTCPDTPHIINKLSETWCHFDKIVSVSANHAAELSYIFPALKNKFCVMHNMIDMDALIVKGTEHCIYRREGFINIVSVGNFVQRKHFENVILASELMLLNKIVKFHWQVVGDGEMRQQLTDLIEKKGLGNYIELVGSKSNPYPYIQQADIFVHPSYIEALSTVILEAMALETPCVVTKTDIPQDFTKDGVNCIEVEQGYESLYKGIYKLVNSDSSILVKNAHNMIMEKYLPPVIMSQFYSLIC